MEHTYAFPALMSRAIVLPGLVQPALGQGDPVQTGQASGEAQVLSTGQQPERRSQLREGERR
jgi:hypothetical protein